MVSLGLVINTIHTGQYSTNLYQSKPLERRFSMENVLDKHSFSITEARKYLGGGKNGISKYLIYQLLTDGKVKSYWVGNRRFILKSELDRYISESEV